MRVLKCILDSRFGGPHRRSYAVAEHLRTSGIETIFLFGNKGDDPAGRRGCQSVSLGHLQFMRRRHVVVNLLAFLAFLPWNVARIRRILKTERIDVVDVDGVTNLVPALAAGLSGIPIVWHYNDYLPGPVKRLILPIVARLASTVIVQGKRLKEERAGANARLYGKTAVLYPGIDVDTFDPGRYDRRARAALREELGVPQDCPLIGTIGNLNRFKGHACFLRAAGRIRRQVENARFLIVGRKLDTDPDYWEQLQQLTADCGLRNHVIYAGFRDDVPRVLSSLDVFVLSSIRESCPNVLLEAMAMQVPVVATDVGAVSELVIDGHSGFVVPPEEPEAMARAVRTCLTQPSERIRHMVEAARKRVETEFGIDILTRQQKHIYETLHRQRVPSA